LELPPSWNDGAVARNVPGVSWALLSGFGSASFQSVLPVGLFNCSQSPDVQTVHGLSE